MTSLPLSIHNHSQSYGFLFRHWRLLRTRAANLGRLCGPRGEIRQLMALDGRFRENISLIPFETQRRASISAFHPAAIVVNALMRAPCR